MWQMSTHPTVRTGLGRLYFYIDDMMRLFALELGRSRILKGVRQGLGTEVPQWSPAAKPQ